MNGNLLAAAHVSPTTNFQTRNNVTETTMLLEQEA